MTFEEAKQIINNMDWSKLSNDELEAISTIVKLVDNEYDDGK